MLILIFDRKADIAYFLLMRLEGTGMEVVTCSI